MEEAERDRQDSFSALGVPIHLAVQGEQPHAAEVGVVARLDQAGTRIPKVDALITQLTGIPLIIRVADCGPIYFYDPVRQAIGLAHSGRKGTEANIAGATISAMAKVFGSRPEDLIVQLGPCIRPPHYEVNFAGQIQQQVLACGVVQYADCGICTASNLTEYYSYRAEKGHTGRLWAVLMLLS
jgi:copper oxidase (laccase) domain-containing protein